MADTIREKIISAVETGLKNYSSFVALGSPDIYRGKVFFTKSEPPPLITIVPRPESSERAQYGGDNKTMQVDFHSIVAIGSADPSELGEAVLGELITSVFSIEPTNVQDMIYRSGGVDEYPESNKAETITVGITVDYVYSTETGDPYTAM